MEPRVVAQLLSLAIGRRFEILQSMRLARTAQQPTDSPDFRKLVLEREVNDAAIAQLQGFLQVAA